MGCKGSVISSGTSEAKRLQAHEGLVRKFVDGCKAIGTAYDKDDLLQEARIAVLLALREHNPEQHGPFSNYAWKRMQDSLSAAQGMRRPGPRGAERPRVFPPLPASLDAGDDGDSLHDLLGIDGDQEANAIKRLDLERALDTLTDTELHVLALRALPSEPSFDRVAESVGVSRSRAQQIEAAAVSKLSAAVAA
jgi:RNA polymerase sigma factor (sigma-70 family)